MLPYLGFILNKQDSCPQRLIRSEVDILILSFKWCHTRNHFVKPNFNLVVKVVSALIFYYLFPFLQKIFLVSWNSYLGAPCQRPWLHSSVPASISSLPCLTSHGVKPPFLSLTKSEQPHPSRLPWTIIYWDTDIPSIPEQPVMWLCVIANSREINVDIWA